MHLAEFPGRIESKPRSRLQTAEAWGTALAHVRSAHGPGKRTSAFATKGLSERYIRGEESLARPEGGTASGGDDHHRPTAEVTESSPHLQQRVVVFWSTFCLGFSYVFDLPSFREGTGFLFCNIFL